MALRKTIDGLQVLRAFAALAVACAHLNAGAHGGFGVDVFFVISGFIISLTGRHLDPRDFAVKRISRIVPLYWIGTFMAFGGALLIPALFKSTQADLVDLVKSLFFIPFQNQYGSYRPILFLGWSLNYEVFFYLLFFIGLFVAKRVPELFVTVAIAALVTLTLFMPPDSLVNFYGYPIIAEFVFGMWLARLWQMGKLPEIRSPILGLAVCALAIVALISADMADLFDERAIFMGLPAVVLVAAVLGIEHRMRYPAFLLLLGDASYSLYLFHPYVLALGEKALAKLAVSTPVYVLASPFLLGFAILVAVLCHRHVELPANRLALRALSRLMGIRASVVFPQESKNTIPEQVIP